MEFKYIVASAIVALIVILFFVSVKPSTPPGEGFEPGIYVSGMENKPCAGESVNYMPRNVPMLLDDSGTDNNFWLFDRYRDRLGGLYQDAKWIRTGCCTLPFTYDKMLPWGSRLYVDGGNVY
jgi:hypothetical protein